MIDPDYELDRLRQRMIDDGEASIDSIDDMIYNVLKRINEAILMSVSEAVAEITDYAIDIGAEEFLSELQVVENGTSWAIASASGKTDYSIPARPMLPQLLKNAKTAMDGSQYKVIPVGKSNDTARQMTSLHDVLQRRQSDINDARAALHEKTMGARSARANDMATAFADIVNGALQQRSEFFKGAIAAKRAATTTPKPATQEFRTATSKQDESTQWVVPAKEMDMTGTLNDVNARILMRHDDIVLGIINDYEHRYINEFLGSL